MFAGVRNNENATPLHYASIYGRMNIILYLLQKGVKVSFKDEYGSTALHLASQYAQLPTMKLLMLQGLSPHDGDQEGRTPLDLYQERRKKEHVVQRVESSKFLDRESALAYKKAKLEAEAQKIKQEKDSVK